MKRTMKFSVGGQTVEVPQDELEQFNAAAAQHGATPDEIGSYRVDGKDVEVPKSQYDEFSRMAQERGARVEELRTVTMADGSRRSFTTPEIAKFLRSKEYRESEDYTPSEQKSVGWAGFKGALKGAAEGAWEGANAEANFIGKAIPEVGIGLEKALGSAANLGGMAKNPVGDWLVKNAQDNKAWLDAKFPSEVKEWVGYEDWSTKTSDKIGETAALAYKFAPAMMTGGAPFMETIFAGDGVNAFAQSFDNAKANGFSDTEAASAGAASALIAYYGGKLLTKINGKAEGIENPVAKFLAEAGLTGTAMGVQTAANKAVSNITGELDENGNPTGAKPITEGVAGSFAKGFGEGALFHTMNAVPRAVLGASAAARERREARELRKEAILDCMETPNGREFVAKIIDNEGVDAAIRARKEGKDVSRKMGSAADLPDNMSTAERNAVIDGIAKAREAQAERVRVKMDDVQEQALADEISQNLAGGAGDPMFDDVLAAATKRIGDAKELDDPGARARIIAEAFEEVAGTPTEERRDKPMSYEERFAENRRLRTPTRVGEEEIAADQEARAMGRRIEAAGEEQRVNDKIDRFKKMVDIGNAQKREQAEYDEKMTAYEEARAKRTAEMKQGKPKDGLTPLPEKPVETKAEEMAKVPDGRGKMVEKPAEPSKPVAVDNPEKTVAAESSKGEGVFAPAKPKKAEGAKVAKLTEKYVETDGVGESLQTVRHTEDGHVVATDGRILIETTHGYDKATAEEQAKGDVYPNYKQVMPEPKKLVNSVEINPAELVKSIKEATKNAKALKSAKETKEDYTRVVLKVGNRVVMLDADYMRLMAETMDAEGLTTIRCEESGPIAAYGDNTRIVLMPIRGENGFDISLADVKSDKAVVISGHSGKYLGFPEGTPDASAKRIADLKATIEANKSNPVARDKAEKELAKLERAQNARGKFTQGALDEWMTKKLVNPNSGVLAQRAFTAERLSDPKFVEWSAKNNRTPTDDARREYDHEQMEVAKRGIRNLFPNMTIAESPRVIEPAEARRKGLVEVRAKSGDTLGWFNPKTKDVMILPGADAETVTHEIVGHGLYDWLKTNDPAAWRKMRRYALDIAKRNPALKSWIDRVYAGTYGGNIENYIDEYGAFSIQGPSALSLIQAAKTKAERGVIGQLIAAQKDAFADFMAKHGGNRIDMDAFGRMSPAEMMDAIVREVAAGKTVGEVAKPKAVKMSTKTGWSESAKDAWERRMHDYRDPIRRFEADVEKALGRKLREGESAYDEFRKLPGRMQEAFDKTQVKIAEYDALLKKHNISHEDAISFMQAQAAPERNAMIREKYEEAAKEYARRKGKPLTDKEWARFERDHGSGLTDAEAKRRMETFAAHGKLDALNEISDFLLGMQAEGMQERVDAGLVSLGDATKWMEREQHHVPFRSGVDADGEFVNWEPNNTLGAPEFKEAKGRETLAGDVVSWMFDEYNHAFARGAENRARQKLLRLVDAVNKGTGVKIADISTQREGMPIEKLKNDSKEGSVNVFSAKIGGQSMSVNLYGDRGQLIQAAVNGRNLKRASQGVQTFMRLWSNTATTWSPFFGIRNFAADTIDISGNYIGEFGLLGGTKAIAIHQKNVAKLSADLVKSITGGKPSAEFEALMKRFGESGAKISGFKNLGYDEIADMVRTDLKKGKSERNALVKIIAAGGKGLGKSIEGWNSYFEQINRLAAFKTCEEMGMTEGKAAKWSRESTVDFNQKGELTGYTNVAWMFSNSVLGASARQMKALCSSRRGLELAGTLVAFGFAEGAMEALMNGDESEAEKAGTGTGKDVSEYTRANSIYIRKGDKTYRVPFHAGPFSILKYLGNCGARVMLGKTKAEDAAKEVLGEGASVLTHFTGMGSVNFQTAQKEGIGGHAKAALVTAVPSIVQPIAQAGLDMDYTGRSVYRSKFDNYMPWAENGRKSTPEVYRDLAKSLNDATRKDDELKGWLDLAPETYKLVAESVGKNALRDVLNVAATVSAAVGGGELETRETPVKRDFVRESNGNDNRFYAAHNRFEETKKAYDRDKGGWTAEKRKAFLEEHPYLRKGLDGKRSVDRIINKTGDTLKEMGITQLRHLSEGEVRVNRNGHYHYVEPKNPVSEERKEAARKELLRKQARVIEIMGM